MALKKSLEPLLKSHHKKALILGTGGASKAIVYALKKTRNSLLFRLENSFKKRNIIVHVAFRNTYRDTYNYY